MKIDSVQEALQEVMPIYREYEAAYREDAQYNQYNCWACRQETGRYEKARRQLWKASQSIWKVIGNLLPAIVAIISESDLNAEYSISHGNSVLVKVAPEYFSELSRLELRDKFHDGFYRRVVYTLLHRFRGNHDEMQRYEGLLYYAVSHMLSVDIESA